MLRLFLFLLLFAVLLSSACSKNNNEDETALYGTWVNSNAPGDTLVFMSKAGKNILRANMSFNTSLPAYTEMEYSFKDGKLGRVLPASSPVPMAIESFTWKQQGKQFEILGYQLYLFMSSTATKFLYTKIN